MKIIELRSENIKNIKAIRITPGDGAVILEGANGAGKSAVLDSIFMALTGRKIEEPIRNGEKRAEINVDLGAYKVRRIFTEKGDRLEVVSADGAAFKSPQAMLNEILGNLSFDPLQFAEMGKNAEGMRRQRAMLAALVGLDFTAADAERTRLYNERTIKNREIKGGDPTSYRPSASQPLPLEALVGGLEVPKPGTPRQEISMAEAMNNLSALEAKVEAYANVVHANQNITMTRDNLLTNIGSNITAKMGRLGILNQQIAGLQAQQKTMDVEINDLYAEEGKVKNTPLPLQALPEAVPEEAIMKARNDIIMVEEDNKAIRKAIEYDQKLAQLENAKKDVAKLEEAMLTLDMAKDANIKAAKFPIDGLGLTDECVTFDGKPFSQLSTGEQIRVSTAVAMALNPTLKVIVVREGSLLDKTGLEAIVALAKDKDYQLWIERVADNQQVGIYLEDGEIK